MTRKTQKFMKFVP